jgi:hypothetical protein
MCQEKFFKAAYNSKTTHQHQVPLYGNTVIESWIIEDKENDKSNMYGFDLPVGTWMIKVKVNDESYWNAYIHQKLNDDKNSVHILSPAYLYPEGSNLELSPKIILRNKSRYLDVVSVKPEVVPKKLNLLEKIYRKIN